MTKRSRKHGGAKGAKAAPARHAGPQNAQGPSGGALNDPAPLTIELHWRGIFPPPGAGYHRQTCPRCSAARRKSTNRCLRVWVISATEAAVKCKHCDYSERIAA